MKYWEYNELIQTIKEMYGDFLLQNMSPKLALAKTSYEFETVQNDGELENIIVSVALGEIILTHDKVFIGYLNSILKILNRFKPNKFMNELSWEEIRDLSARKNVVLETLQKMPIDYDPYAY